MKISTKSPMFNKFIEVRNIEEFKQAVDFFKKEGYDEDHKTPNFEKAKKWYVFLNHNFYKISTTKEYWTTVTRRQYGLIFKK